jgi:hypothetical protein
VEDASAVGAERVTGLGRGTIILVLEQGVYCKLLQGKLELLGADNLGTFQHRHGADFLSEVNFISKRRVFSQKVEKNECIFYRRTS